MKLFSQSVTDMIPPSDEIRNIVKDVIKLIDIKR